MTDPIIAPPLELMRQMREHAPRYRDGGVGREEWLIERASGWGYEQRGEVNEAKLQQARDQELEACCEWLRHEYGYGEELASKLRTARRPKPQSLKEQALKALAHILNNSSTELGAETIRCALKALPDD